MMPENSKNSLPSQIKLSALKPTLETVRKQGCYGENSGNSPETGMLRGKLWKQSGNRDVTGKTLETVRKQGCYRENSGHWDLKMVPETV